MFAQYHQHQQHASSSSSSSGHDDYASFAHPAPLPLNAYDAKPVQQQHAVQHMDAQHPQQFYAVQGDSPESAPPAQQPYSNIQIAAAPEYIDFAHQQQQQQQEFVHYQQQQHQPPTQPYHDYTHQQQQHVPSPPQQQQQEYAGGRQSTLDFSQPVQLSAADFASDSAMEMQFGVMAGMMAGMKRPRGEKMSSKDFVMPDVSGLSKREARLVKNRAAAFLSRQRKREEFEAMELRVVDLESQNAALLAQLSGVMPTGDAAHAAHIRALQARIAGLEHELAAYRHRVDASPSPPDAGHGRASSYDSFDSSLSGHSRGNGAARMTDGQQQAVMGMGLMALLSLSSMSPPTTRFAFAPAENADEPTPVTATPFNFDSIARWQERLAGSPPSDGGVVEQIDVNGGSDGDSKTEFDIAFSTTNDGRIRCHVSVPRTQLAAIRARQTQPAAAQYTLQPQTQVYAAPGSYPTTPYSHAGSLHSGSSHSLPLSLSGSSGGGRLSGSPEEAAGGVGSHPGSASSFHTTFEAAGYSTAPIEHHHAPQQQQLLGVDASWGYAEQQQQNASAGSSEWGGVTPVAPHPHPAAALPVKQESAVVKQEEPARKQLGPTRRVKVALKAQSGRGEWEVEVC